MRTAMLTVVLALGGTAALLSGCPPTFSELCSGGECGADGGGPDVQRDVGPDVGGPMKECPPAYAPKEHPECIVDEAAVFVSPSGNDGAPGTKARPVQSIAQALKVSAAKTRIYFCEGTYEGTITQGTVLSYFGGLSCDTWQYNGKRAKIHSAAGSVALTISDAQEIVVADLDFEAAAATTKSGSSVAGLVANSSVTLTRTSFTSGAGGDGESTPAERDAFVPPAAPNGWDVHPIRPPNPWAKENDLCTESVGGAGGFDVAGKAGLPAIAPPHPDGTTDGAGGAANMSENCSPAAHKGSNGPGGLAGAAATSYGFLDPNGWHPNPGDIGASGGAGQGGGGAGGRTSAGGGTNWFGASGGAGGCGGLGGSGGVGGGSSIALVAFNSQVSIRESRFNAAAAGTGGIGGTGQLGQAGGEGGKNTDTLGCAGAAGGTGGSGGGGGGGTGGSSVGILWSRTALGIDGRPAQTAATFDGILVAAAGGKGGTGGPGGPPPAGVADEKVRGIPGATGKQGLASALFSAD